MDEAIVEIVCGSVIDPCWCGRCLDPQSLDPQSSHPPRCHVTSRKDKLDILLDSLTKVVDGVTTDDDPDPKFAFSLEIEPGESYVLNSHIARHDEGGDPLLKMLFDAVDASDKLRYRVGLNLDIAHMRIAGIPADALRPYMSRIAHAHISDHPRLHTRDQVPGSWTSTSQIDSDYLPYTTLLIDRALDAGTTEATGQKNKLPYSFSFSLELEGNDSYRPLHEGFAIMKCLRDTAYRWRAE